MLQKTLDQAVEMCILFSQLVDFLDRVDDGGVMLAAKAPTDLGK
jgi:hypothetical protein